MDGLAELKVAIQELLGHGIGNGKVDVAETAAKEELVPAIHDDQRVVELALLSKDGMAIVVPVDDDLASAHPGNKEGNMESRDRRRVLIKLADVVCNDGCASYLDDDPFSGRRSVHHGFEECPDLVHELQRNLQKELQIAPGEPFGEGSESVECSIRVADELRVTRRF